MPLCKQKIGLLIAAILAAALLFLSIGAARLPIQEGFETVTVVGWLGTFRPVDMYVSSVDKMYNATTKQLLWDRTMNPPKPENPIYNTKQSLIILFNAPQKMDKTLAAAVDPTNPVQSVLLNASGNYTLVDGTVVLPTTTDSTPSGTDSAISPNSKDSTPASVTSPSDTMGTVSAPTSSTSGVPPPAAPTDTWIDYILIGLGIFSVVLVVGSSISSS